MIWLTYAVAEYLFTSVVTASTYGAPMFSPWFWSLTGKLAVSYAFLGAGFGALSGAYANRKALTDYEADRMVQSLVVFSLVAAFLVQAAITEASAFSVWDLETITAAALLGTGLILNLYSKSWFERFGRYLHPWAVVTVLVAGPWINHSLLRMAVFAGAVFGGFVLGRLRPGRVGLTGVRALAAGFLLLLLVAIGGTTEFQTGLQHPAVANGKPAANRTLAARTSPNIVLITMDTVRADHLPIYGYARNTAPHLTAFAAEATLYKNSIAVSNMTLATHASIFTGLYPSAHGAHSLPRNPTGSPLRPGIPTVAGMLSRNGYLSMAVVANHAYLDPFYEVGRGFQAYDIRQPVPIVNPEMSTDLRLLLRYGIRQILDLFTSTAEFDRVSRRAAEINDAAFDLLNDARSRQMPFFLFLNYMDAHGPYVPPAPYGDLFPGRLRNFSDTSYRRLELELVRSERPVTPREKEHLISQYDGAIAYLDSELGSLLSGLKARGLYDDALIIITSDHGENFGDRNLLGHWISLYQDEVSVPLIVKYPHQSQGKVVESMVSQIDIAPTVLEAANVPAPATFAGKSLIQPVDPERLLYSEAFFPRAPYSQSKLYPKSQRAVYQGFKKLIDLGIGKRELYDLAMDPSERRDVYRDNQELAARFETALSAWAAHQPGVSPAGSTPGQVLKQLKSLGYVQ
ncbi:MAG: sulfatase-like hydrolase/transferase [Bryobacterales bacterium]|nr:sulfatase-like hydrolase/transferase [Bryobacterales bacterium]